VVFDYDATRPLDQQPGWRHAQPMANPRILCDATLLPDGQVLVTGGVSRGWTNHSYPKWAVRQAELFNPDTESFRTVATARLDRRYHATALLLPDATVMKMGSTGGFEGGTGTDGRPWITSHTEAEIYHPPYAWRGPRPSVMPNVPRSLSYASTATVDVVGHAVSGCRVALMKAGAVTHGLDMDQRCVFLQIAARGGTAPAPGGMQRNRLPFRGPTGATAAPPGPYLLFVLDDWGVPSVGTWCVVG
jgi:hypothetical protein